MNSQDINDYLLQLEEYFSLGTPIEDICGCCYLNISGLIELLDEYRKEMNSESIKKLDSLIKKYVELGN